MSLRVDLMLAWVSVAALAGGCGFDDGRAWGEVELTLTVALTPPASRLDGARLKTANDYRIAIDAFELEVEAVALVGGVEGATGFDPADPPAGYSLCHNGHCHAADGRLVAYEDIASEVGGVDGGGGGGTVVSASGSDSELAAGEVVPVTLTCIAGCEVAEPTRVVSATITVAAWTVRGTAYDARTDAARLPAEGIAFELTGAEVDWSGPASLAFGPGEPYARALPLAVTLPVDLFDGVEWDTMNDAARSAAIGAALAGASLCAAAGCDEDHEHEHEEVSLGAEACEHLEEGPIKTVTAGADAASATDASDEHTRWDVTLVDVEGGNGGFIELALADAGEHVIVFTSDVDLMITNANGDEVTTTKAMGSPSGLLPEATSVADCADVKAAFTVDFSVGTYTLAITPVAAAVTSVSFVLIPAEGDEH